MSSSSHTDRIMRLLDEHDDLPGFPDKNPYDLNSKIMLVAIISLSVVVVLVILLHTYARCVLRRQSLQRAAALRRLGLTVAHVHSTAEPPKTGLDPSVIANLPVFVYKRVEGESDADVECAVCLSMLEDEEMTRVLPNCKHSFHAQCIDTWLISHTTCPICRTEAEPSMTLLPEPREGPVAAAAAPTAPPLERVNSVLSCAEGTSEDGKVVSSGSISRLGSSFRRMLSRERSSRRLQCGQEDGFEDLERQ